MRDTPKTAAAGPPAAAAAAAGGAPTVTVDAEAYAALLASNERLQRSLNAELRDPSKLREALGGALADALAREQQEKTMLIRENCELARQRWLLQQRAAALQPYQNHHHVYAAAAAATGAMPPGMSLDDDESIASSAGPMGVMPPLHAPPPPSALLAHHIEKVQRFTASQPQLDVGLGHDHSRPRTATPGGHAPGARALSRPRTAAAKGSQIEAQREHTALHEATRYAEENLVLSRERAALVVRVQELELERARLLEGLLIEQPPAAASAPYLAPATTGDDDDASVVETKGDAGAVTDVKVERRRSRADGPDDP